MDGYSYKNVEAALGRLHGVDEQSVGAFRGRLKHFNRLGLVPSSPGKGQRVRYSLEDVFRWAYALEFSELGVDPTVMKLLLDKTWATARECLVHGSGKVPPDSGTDRLMVLDPIIMSRTFTKSDDFIFGITTAAKLPDDYGDIDRLMLINLSRLARRTWQILALQDL